MSFELPENLVEKVKRFFPRSGERQKVALQLMYLDHWPSTKEKMSIGGAVGRTDGIVDQTIRRLREEELFIKPHGSVPLYRHTLEQESKAKDPAYGALPSIITEIPMENVELEDTKPAFNLGRDYVDPQEESRINRLEVELHSIKNSIESFMAKMETTVQGLSAKVPDSPADHNPAEAFQPGSQQSMPTENLGAESDTDSLEDRLERIEALMQDRDPFADLSKDQMVELLRSQPQALVALANPDLRPGGEGQTDRVKAQPVTLRPIILMLTTYSQMLYEKAVHDGYFEGTLSDFANFTMEQYFTDRGWSLDWSKRQPDGRMRLG